MGVDTDADEALAFAIGASLGGVAGAFYASFKTAPSLRSSLQHLRRRRVHGHPRRHGIDLGRDPRRVILGYLNVEGLATLGSELDNGAGIDFDPRSQFGFFGVLIVLMMLIRPQG